MKLNIKNLGRIKEAEIKIDGITIIAGENNTGKTTVGKVLFSCFNLLNNLEKDIYSDKKYSVQKEVYNLYHLLLKYIIITSEIDKIFDDIRASEKTVIITSNKSYTQLTNSLKNSSKKDNADYINGRLTSRLLNLKIVEVELKRNTIRVETDKKII